MLTKILTKLRVVRSLWAYSLFIFILKQKQEYYKSDTYRSCRSLLFNYWYEKFAENVFCVIATVRLLISRRDGIWKFSYNNENCFVSLTKTDLKTNECPTIHKNRSDDSLHMPNDSHYIHTHSIISFFHARWILVLAEVIVYVNASVTHTKMISLTFSFARKSKSKSTKCVFATFPYTVCETVRKVAAILKYLFITCCHRRRQTWFLQRLQ